MKEFNFSTNSYRSQENFGTQLRLLNTCRRRRKSKPPAHHRNQHRHPIFDCAQHKLAAEASSDNCRNVDLCVNRVVACNWLDSVSGFVGSGCRWLYCIFNTTWILNWIMYINYDIRITSVYENTLGWGGGYSCVLIDSTTQLQFYYYYMLQICTCETLHHSMLNTSFAKDVVSWFYVAYFLAPHLYLVQLLAWIILRRHLEWLFISLWGTKLESHLICLSCFELSKALSFLLCLRICLSTKFIIPIKILLHYWLWIK